MAWADGVTQTYGVRYSLGDTAYALADGLAALLVLRTSGSDTIASSSDGVDYRIGYSIVVLDSWQSWLDYVDYFESSGLVSVAIIASGDDGMWGTWYGAGTLFDNSDTEIVVGSV